MEHKKLRDELAHGQLQKIYLLYGEERFLVTHYAAAIEKASAAQKDVFEGAIPVGEIAMAAETLTFDGGKRLIFVRDSKLFASGRKAEAEALADYLPRVPDDTIMVFIEAEVDRRTRLYKKVAELGRALDCVPLTPQDLTKWLVKFSADRGKTMSPTVAAVLLRTCGHNMTTLSLETDKLINYCGDKKEISSADITAICTPTLESRIFDLTNAVGVGRPAAALKIYRNMLLMKESPIMVLTMIIRQLRIILMCKCAAEKKMSTPQIARELSLRDFIVTEALVHGRRFTTDKLVSALTNCQDTDIKIKTGLLGQEIGVEMLIVSLAGSM